MGSPEALISHGKRKTLLPNTPTTPNSKNTTDTSLESTKESKLSEAFQMDHRYQPLLFLDFIENEMVVVERPELEVLRSLPPSYYKHAYGT
jgi:hypothetical protein